MAFEEIIPASFVVEDGADQRSGERVFESNTPVQAWQGDPSLPTKGSNHPNYPDMVLEKFEAVPLIGNARTRVVAYYSNYDKYSATVFLGRKQGQTITWTTTFTRVQDQLRACLRSKKTVQRNGTDQIQRVWTVVTFDLPDQERLIRKASVVVPRLTDAQLAMILRESGKLHYFGTDAGDPTFSSGNWYRFTAPDGLESSKTEVTIDYSWLHDPGITTKDVPGVDYAFGIPESGYLRKPWHLQIPNEPDDPTQAANPITFSQFRPYDVGAAGGRAWQSLPGMVL